MVEGRFCDFIMLAIIKQDQSIHVILRNFVMRNCTIASVQDSLVLLLKPLVHEKILRWYHAVRLKECAHWLARYYGKTGRNSVPVKVLETKTLFVWIETTTGVYIFKEMTAIRKRRQRKERLKNVRSFWRGYTCYEYTQKSYSYNIIAISFHRSFFHSKTLENTTRDTE